MTTESIQNNQNLTLRKINNFSYKCAYHLVHLQWRTQYMADLTSAALKQHSPEYCVNSKYMWNQNIQIHCFQMNSTDRK